MAKRKPHSEIAGYVAERKCLRPCGGHVVIYDRKNGGDWIDADDRWVVFHEPSTLHVSVPSLAFARDIMKNAAAADEPSLYDILPMEGGTL